ncbi:MAG: UvrD-helicase domain-containing protein, partial [Clostridiales bacterium]|nr:UvrD-helicase domain-containing protein [Clostridiales bacterium]
MAEVTWTEDQQSVIDLRNRDILVSAAAGSGKTAVLVERIIKKVTDSSHPVDIDQILVVTFTKAAAAEMKQRISEAIDAGLEENPDSQQLKRQASLIHAAQITTIDSFCLSIVRNYFHTIELEPGYRVADENECKIWMSNVLDALLEEKYQEASPSFLRFVESFAPGKNDDRLAEYVNRLYQFCISHPWPLIWLKEQKETLDVQTIEQLEESGWLKSLFMDTTVILNEALSLAKKAEEMCL